MANQIRRLLEWQPIDDLPSMWSLLRHDELASLSEVWSDQKATLERHGVLRAFNERLAREFAIETGLLERLYTLDRGITQLLIERGFDAALIPHRATNKSPQLVTALLRDQHEALQQLFDFVNQGRKLTVGYIKELHALLTRHQATVEAIDSLGHMIEVELLHGEWKKLPNNPTRDDGCVHEYCPPTQVASEMDRLVELHQRHMESSVPSEIAAAWLHHRFTQIHPFQDGNGRVARCLASLVFLRDKWFPFVVRNDDDRDIYIRALEAADAGDLGPLVHFSASTQKRAFIQALSLSRQVEREARVAQVIGAARRDVETRNVAIRKRWESLRETVEVVAKSAHHRFEEVRSDLERSFATLDPELVFFIEDCPPQGSRSHWFQHQVIEVARVLGYFANTRDYHRWLRLVLKNSAQSTVLVSWHTLGREYTGVVAASACYFQRAPSEDSESIGKVHALVSDVFQMNYAEDPTSTQERFEGWLEEVLVHGLEHWRRDL
jgi:Fic family protein